MSDSDIPAGVNDLPNPAEFAAPEDSAPRKKKRRALPDPESLTTTSLVDIMTIILVFLLKS